jgi:glycosyltransferase involved in cell wall biosynthesis
VMVHPRTHVGEIIVVENGPHAGHPDNPLHHLPAKTRGVVRRVEMPSPCGTSPARNRIFEVATGEWVCVVDPHVLLYPGFFEALRSFYVQNGHDNPDLLHGPLMTEAGGVLATHMNDQWRAGMWGTWGLAWVAPSGRRFSCADFGDGRVAYRTLDDVMEQGSLNAQQNRLPESLAWAGHEAVLGEICRAPRPWFPIPGHGMGMFACRRDAWLPFHPDARGFGGEEMTTGVRYRRAGRRCWCVTGARWWHHFDRPNGALSGRAGANAAPYRLTDFDKARNYVLEFRRLGMDLAPVYEHFAPLIGGGAWADLAAGRHWSRWAGPRPADVPPDGPAV